MNRTPNLLVLGALLLAFAAGCGDTLVDPFDNDSRYFTIWGFLDAGQSNQVVRVIPVTRWPAEITDPNGNHATIDANVYSIDLQSGEEVRWDHRFKLLSDSTYAHLFEGSVFVVPGRRYRLEVRRSDGIVTSAETHVPDVRRNGLLGHSDPATDADGIITQNVVLNGISTPWRFETIYRLSDGFGARNVYLPRGQLGAPTAAGWELTVNLTADQADVRAAVFDPTLENGVPRLGLEEVGIRVRIRDDEWVLPLEAFDPESQAQPDVLSNVVNGHGYWGSVGYFFATWPVTSETSIALGWAF